MKILKNNQTVLCVLSCIFIALFLSGCKERGGMITVFDNLPESSFLTEVKTSLEDKKPVVVAFLAEWCPHCKKYKPDFLEIKEQYQDKVSFINIDADDPTGESISERFQVRGIPTTAFIRRDGSVLKIQVGEIEKEKLSEIVEELLKSKKKRRGEPIAPFPIEKPQVTTPEVKDIPPQELIEEGAPPLEPPPLPSSEPAEETELEVSPAVPETEDENKDLPDNNIEEESSEQVIPEGEESNEPAP